MEVNGFLKKLTKISISLPSICGIKKKYLALYRAGMVRLYDEGFIADPTWFRRGEILKLIREYGIVNMVQTSSKVEVTSHMVDYAYTIGGIEEEGLRFLKSLRDCLKYKEFCRDIDIFYDVNNIVSGKKVSIRPVYTGSRILMRKYNISVPVVECFYSNSLLGCEVGYESMLPYIYRKALDLLGIEDQGQDSIFVRGMSREDEIRFCDLILDGKVDVTGSGKEAFDAWMESHVWNFSEDSHYRFSKTGLFSYIYDREYEYVNQCRRELIDKCIEKYGEENILYLTSVRVYIRKKADTVKFPVSQFIVFAEHEDRIDTEGRNVFEGYTGEVYPIEDFDSGYSAYTGCPIELYVDDSKKLFVDFEQTSYSETGAQPWFSCNDDISIDFDESYYQNGVYPDGSYEDQVFRALGDAEAGKVVGEIKMPSTTDEEKELEEAKLRVFKEIIVPGTYKSIKNGLVAFKNKKYTDGENFLSRIFLKPVIKLLREYIDSGYSVAEVMDIARIGYSVEEISAIMNSKKGV